MADSFTPALKRLLRQAGGRLIAAGTPDQVAADSGSCTAPA